MSESENWIVFFFKEKITPKHLKTVRSFDPRVLFLSSCFNIKDKTKFPHKHDLVYHAKCAEESYNDDYIGKTAKRISEKVLDHSGRDKNSHILKHQIEKNTLVHNTRILKILAVASVITLQ